MKKLVLLILFLAANIQLNKSQASGSSVGNGFAPESYLKAASMSKSKTPEKLCIDANGQIENIGAEHFCKIKDGKIKMQDLIDAAKKNDLTKK